MSGDKLLFTPGPLTTSLTVKQAMMHDLGSRDAGFMDLVRDIRRRLLQLGGVDDGSYEAVLLQGSGTRWSRRNRGRWTPHKWKECLPVIRQSPI